MKETRALWERFHDLLLDTVYHPWRFAVGASIFIGLVVFLLMRSTLPTLQAAAGAAVFSLILFLILGFGGASNRRSYLVDELPGRVVLNPTPSGSTARPKRVGRAAVTGVIIGAVIAIGQLARGGSLGLAALLGLGVTLFVIAGRLLFIEK